MGKIRSAAAIQKDIDFELAKFETLKRMNHTFSAAERQAVIAGIKARVASLTAEHKNQHRELRAKMERLRDYYRGVLSVENVKRK